jgi:hypothetical protein
MKLQWIVWLAIAAACVSSTKHDDATGAALRALCAAPGVGSSRAVVLDRTAMVVQLPALHQHFSSAKLSPKDVEMLAAEEERLIQHFASEPVTLPRGTPCSWRLKKSREPYSEETLIELSNVVPAGTAANPTPGVFIRVSAGGRPGADFYWVPILFDATKVTAETPVRLDVADG